MTQRMQPFRHRISLPRHWPQGLYHPTSDRALHITRPCKIFDMNPLWHLPVSQGLMDRLSGPIPKDLHIQRAAKISTGVLLSFSNRYGRQMGANISMSKRNVLMDKDDVVWPKLLIIYRLMILSMFMSASFLLMVYE